MRSYELSKHEVKDGRRGSRKNLLPAQICLKQGNRCEVLNPNADSNYLMQREERRISPAAFAVSYSASQLDEREREECGLELVQNLVKMMTTVNYKVRSDKMRRVSSVLLFLTALIYHP